MTNFPWPMDKPISEMRLIVDKNYHGQDADFLNYLIARLKKAESERDYWKRCLDEAVDCLDKHGINPSD